MLLKRIFITIFILSLLLTFIAPPPIRAAGKTRLVDNGAWCWFADPRAVCYGGKTHFGWVDNGGSIIVGSYFHSKKTMTSAVLSKNYCRDDHANPSLLIRPDKRIMVFWSGHYSQGMHYKISKKPNDISSWGPEYSVGRNTHKGKNGYTYPNPVMLRREKNKIFLFFRGSDKQPTITTTMDGKKWTKARTLLKSAGCRPYVKIDSNGKDTIYFTFTDGNPNTVKTSIYFMFYRKGVFYNADKTVIGNVHNLPLKLSKIKKIYDYNQSKIKSWVHDIAVDNKRRPIVVYSTFPSRANHRYYYARWIGGKWSTYKITSAGGSISGDKREPYYSGGIAINHSNPSIVYLSRKKRNFEIEKWRTKNGGKNWQRRVISSSSKTKDVRPTVPRNSSKGVNVLWMSGSYPDYNNYKTSIMGLLQSNKVFFPSGSYSFSVKGTSVVFKGRQLSKGPVRFQWRFGDGQKDGKSLNTNHNYQKPGVYYPMLTVTNKQGMTNNFVRKVDLRLKTYIRAKVQKVKGKKKVKISCRLANSAGAKIPARQKICLYQWSSRLRRWIKKGVLRTKADQTSYYYRKQIRKSKYRLSFNGSTHFCKSATDIVF
ncbi:MAG: PKD domain-containing protein [Actinobacteria bacterium]|nr:MAG: PKD domain-containing protein [Actinomycetota bacterium]